MTGEVNGTRPYLMGMFLVLVGWCFYVWRFSQANLVLPYYLPVIVTVGFGVMVRGFLQKRSILRVLGLILALLMTLVAWMIIFGLSLPKYDGPATVGATAPAFEAQLAMGGDFQASNLKDGKNRIIVFYRGIW